ncbi:MAG: Gfo/Idh/MocA family oxidoreductase, partial [Orrella sp.]
MKSMKVGLLGLGVVGGGTWNVLRRNAQEITRRAGRQIEVVCVAVRDVAKARARIGEDVCITDDPYEIVNDPNIDIVVELIGGITTAKALVMSAIENGKHVVTANKALLATHGTEIFEAASAKGVMVAFEGAV